MTLFLKLGITIAVYFILEPIFPTYGGGWLASFAAAGICTLCDYLENNVGR